MTNEKMNALLDSVEKFYKEDGGGRKPPAAIVAKALRDHIIKEYAFEEEEANLFVMRARIAVWNQAMGDQIERASKIAKTMFDRYMNNFDDYNASHETIAMAGDQFGVYLVPEEENN